MDLTPLLTNWPWAPQAFQVRELDGEDGCGHLQIRLELGVLQMARTGRPDGTRPHGHTSMLDAIRALGPDAAIAPEIARALQDEIGQHDTRAMALMALGDLEGVSADARHMIDCVDEGLRRAAREDVRAALAAALPRAVTLLASTQARMALADDDRSSARSVVERSLERLEQTLSPAEFEHLPEVAMLRDMLDGLIPRLPSSQRAELEHRLRAAIADENYELAVILRNELRQLS